MSVELGPLNVLVGPNQAGKSNFLDLIEFLGDSARYDLPDALEMRGGIDRVRFRGASESGSIVINVDASVTRYSHVGAPDEYRLSFWTRRTRPDARILLRNEEFKFKRTRGQGRRITVKGSSADLVDVEESSGEAKDARRLPLSSQSLALSTLRRLPKSEGGDEIARVASLFTTFRVFNVDVEAARQPGPLELEPLRSNAGNLASSLIALSEDSERFGDLLEDARSMIPGLDRIAFEEIGGAGSAIAVTLIEKGLRNPTYLQDASFGAIRALALLALLYDPDPPQITCIEEIDHGLHPYVFDRLVLRLREASARTQLLIATHSPALVNRLSSDELIVVERAPDGSTHIPAVDPDEVRAKESAANGRLRLGELWFSGTLGGVPR